MHNGSLYGMYFIVLIIFNSLADYIAAANHRLDEPKEQSQPQIQDSSVTSQANTDQYSAAQVSQFPTSNGQYSAAQVPHDHNPAAEVSVPQKAVPVDTTEVDAILEKFKTEVEVCKMHVCNVHTIVHT